MPKPNDITVRAGLDEYPVIFRDYRSHLTHLTRGCGKIVIVSNPTVFALHGRDMVRRFFADDRRVVSIMIGDGERYKNQRTVNALYEQLFDVGVDRYDFVVAFGGGVVGDTAGYAAATFKRGVPFVQIPTTLLAMVDASIGGKVGINHRRGKNQIGTFYQPKAVVIEPKWLATLRRREMVDGLAEIVKAGFLSSPELLKKAVDTAPEYSTKTKKDLVHLVEQAIRFKAHIVSLDVYDYGIRRILNFGHTFAHAIEAAEGYRGHHHGEAVLAGMIGAVSLSHATGCLPDDLTQEYLEYLRPMISYIPPLKREIDDYLAPIGVDKKSRSRRPVFVLLEKIGRPVVREVESQRRINEAVSFMRAYVNIRGKI